MDFTAIVSVILILVSTIASLWKIFAPLIAAKLDATQLTSIRIIVETALYAAEQIYNQIGQGKEKKQFVKDYILTKYPTLNAEDLDILIEGLGNELGLFK